MIVKDDMETKLDDLDILNELYNKSYITIEEFQNIKNRIIDSMIESLKTEKAQIDDK